VVMCGAVRCCVVRCGAAQCFVALVDDVRYCVVCAVCVG
jgi:hypothetical protein